MQPSRRHCFYALLALLAAFPLAWPTHASKLTITTTPSGATVKINGRVAGTTPYTAKYPGGYFHKPHTAFGAHLNHAIHVRISKDGYIVKKLTLTGGPYEWVSFNGRHKYRYFLLRSKRFDIKLVSIPDVARDAMDASGRAGPMRPPPSKVARSRSRSSRAGRSKVDFASDPPGADIYVDGNFVGQTPSTIELPAGLHHIVVKSEGRQKWERNLDVLKGSRITLRASLKSLP